MHHKPEIKVVIRSEAVSFKVSIEWLWKDVRLICRESFIREERVELARAFHGVI